MSPYLFAMSMDVLACGIKDVSPWCMIVADDIVLRSTRREEVENKLRQGAAECQQKERKLYTRGSMYIGTWMGTQISIYTRI